MMDLLNRIAESTAYHKLNYILSPKGFIEKMDMFIVSGSFMLGLVELLTKAMNFYILFISALSITITFAVKLWSYKKEFFPEESSKNNKKDKP